MTITYAVLPRRCPIGFEFEYDAAAAKACGRTARKLKLYGWNGRTPLFSDGEQDELWSVAMETEAAMAFKEKQDGPQG